MLHLVSLRNGTTPLAPKHLISSLRDQNCLLSHSFRQPEKLRAAGTWCDPLGISSAHRVFALATLFLCFFFVFGQAPCTDGATGCVLSLVQKCSLGWSWDQTQVCRATGTGLQGDKVPKVLQKAPVWADQGVSVCCPHGEMEDAKCSMCMTKGTAQGELLIPGCTG